MNFGNENFSEKIKYQLSSLSHSNRLPHAIIVAGGNRESRQNVAEFLCKYAVCSGENKPCFTCKNCVKAESHSHPDITVVKGSDDTKAKIYNKKIIDNIIRDTAIIPNEADSKVFLFYDVDEKLPIISQNALLKTLEEPPGDVIFVMTCKDASLMLDTIISRSTLINIPNDEVFSETGVALSEEIALSLLDVNEYALLRATYKLSKRDIFLETMPPLRMIIRDTLVLLSGGKPVTQSEAPKKLQRKLTREKSLSLLDTIEKAQRMAKGNGNINLLSTWLCTELRRITWQK